jgi:gentisate 1,2-dioxygenase
MPSNISHAVSPGLTDTPQRDTPSRSSAPAETADVIALDDLYKDLAREQLAPLWSQVGELMPGQPTPSARPYIWQWKTLLGLAERAGDLVRIDRGGERRAIALANPGLGGLPFATPTLWAAIQYLAPGETAPEHRHTQNAFRFVLEGQGVWTVVDGDPVSMQRGDLLLTPGWHFHGHQNVADSPMVWLDGLDIPFVQQTDSGFFAYGSNMLTDTSTPDRSRAERLWAHPGLQPVALLGARRSSPIAAYRWQHTDRALAEQLEIEREGQPATMGPGHAAVQYSNPTTGGDVMPTIRAEFHRFRAGAVSEPRREVGSSVWQVFAGSGAVLISGIKHRVERGDLFVVPSWAEYELTSGDGLDLFRFSDAPIFEALGLYRIQVGRQ